MGHLVRCLTLSRVLGGRVTVLLTHMGEPGRKLARETVGRIPARIRPGLLPRLPASARWDLVVVDARGITVSELDELSAHGLVACLDEGGEARDFAPFVLDALPAAPGRTPANQDGPGFLFLPRRIRTSAPAAIHRVLLSLGGEDREGLGGRLAASMLSSGLCRADQLTVVQGPLSGGELWPSGVTVVRRTDDFHALLARHDVLVTHFGMTAFESLAAGIPAVLFNPTPYHALLGKAAGFPMIGVGTPNMDALKKLLSNPVRLYAQVDRFNESLGKDRTGRLARVLRPLVRIGSPSCPVCGRAGNRVVARFPDRTYRRCAACETIGLESFAGRRKRYDAGYFSAEYKAQYGRTYLEDFEAIRSASRPRAAIIHKLLGSGRDGVVLDVGCAYGPFLAAAAEAGLSGFGLDISAGAAAYVKKTLGIPAVCASFETVPRTRLPRGIRAVTMWYVIEHFPRTGEILAKAASLLPPGGVLAFSTPNGRGVSARRDLQAFLRASPADHFTVLSPRGLGKILAAHGLSLRLIRVTGHHPERFPGAIGAAARRWAAAARLLRAASVLFRLGDTFEAYAVKGSR